MDFDEIEMDLALKGARQGLAKLKEREGEGKEKKPAVASLPTKKSRITTVTDLPEGWALTIVGAKKPPA
jgi:hypothetical protein